MRKSPTRRDALKVVATSFALPVGIGNATATPLATPYQPSNFSREEFDLITTLVEMIIPTTDTPGAAVAGVDRIIDERFDAEFKNRGLGYNHPKRHFEALKTELALLRKGLALLHESKFSELSEEGRSQLLEEFSINDGERSDFFTLLKDLTVTGYYSTEIGMVHELGYRGNTFLREFPGCTHEEHQ